MKTEQTNPKNQPNPSTKSFSLPKPGQTGVMPGKTNAVKPRLKRRARPEPWGGAVGLPLGVSTPEASRFHAQVLSSPTKQRVKAVVVSSNPQPTPPHPMNEALQPPRNYAKEARQALEGLGEFRLLKGGKPRRGFARVALLVGVALLALWVLLGIIPSLKVPPITFP